MFPLLRSLADGAERSTQETIEALQADLGLSDADIAEPMPSGRGPLFTNRIAWSKLHLKRAGLLDSPKRGVYRITDRGRELLHANPSTVNMAYLARYPEYLAFRNRKPAADDSAEAAVSAELVERTPEEYIEYGYSRLRSALAEEILGHVAKMPPASFEQLVVDLLVAIGYGGSQRDAGHAIGRSGDEGIDGIIKEDRLGLETIYIQAKRWQGAVGRPEIQRFAGALQGQRARKGVLITTSDFTKDARAYAASIQSTIVLVDGTQLAELMIDHGIGVALVDSYQIKRLDSDYFAAE
ncbi:MAG: restriction endonuclease [Gammaproteobacteria bacterium]